MGGNSGSGGTAGTDVPGAPLVEIQEPTAVEDPALGDILLDGAVRVVCIVQPSDVPGSTPVDPSSVMISAVDASGNEVAAALSQGPEPERYEANLLLPASAHGPVSFRCNAEDTSTPPRAGSDEVVTFFDAGPEITPIEPLAGSGQALERAIPFSFRVTPRPLIDGDEAAAEICEVTLIVGGVEIEDVTETSPGVYTASVNLADRARFPVAPVGSVPVRIMAANSREPEPKDVELNYTFELDAEGPAIGITAPESNELVAGEVKLAFDVSGDVVPESIVVSVNNSEFRYDVAQTGTWNNVGSSYTFTFDTTDPDFRSSWQLTTNIRAVDEVGNEGSTARTFLLDNFAPFVHLNPAFVRELDTQQVPNRCSMPFDPLGDRAVDDEERVLPAATVRALVWDLTNSVGGLTKLTHSTTDPDSVSLFLQPAAGQPIVFDERGGDGVCDAILKDPRPIQVRMSPVTSAGTAVRGASTTPLACEYPDSNDDPPGTLRTLCSGFSDMYRVIDHSLVGPESVVYGLGEPDDDDVACTGGEWEIGALVEEEGWACLAAEASDFLGNRDVSPPIALCVSDGVAPEPSCALDPDEDGPSCADDCNPRTATAPLPVNPFDRTWTVRLQE